jgi:hypothetical protein
VLKTPRAIIEPVKVVGVYIDESREGSQERNAEALGRASAGIR